MLNIKESQRRDKVYSFTNENISSYSSLYSLEGSRILSVIGSEDQYFTSILNGAEDVELYDINRNAWDYFLLKYYAISRLPYEEFVLIFIINRLNNQTFYRRVKNHLPKDVLGRINTFLTTHQSLSEMLLSESVNPDNKMIPYLDRENYYKLQSLLKRRELPKVHFYNLKDLPVVLNNEYYDVIFTSNIFKWLNFSVLEYRNLLEGFNSREIQALYAWNAPDYLLTKMEENGFSLDLVDSVYGKGKKDYVFTLRK